MDDITGQLVRVSQSVRLSILSSRGWRNQDIPDDRFAMVAEAEDVSCAIMMQEPLVQRAHAPAVNKRDCERPVRSNPQAPDGAARQPRHLSDVNRYGCLRIFYDAVRNLEFGVRN